MEQAELDKIHSQIADLRKKLINVVGSHATRFGLSTGDTKDLLAIVQPEFMQAWFSGVPADRALIDAIRKADRQICDTIMQRETAAGRSAAEVFEDIKATKAKAGGSEADADKAQAAFNQALDSGSSPSDALQAAFAAVA